MYLDHLTEESSLEPGLVTQLLLILLHLLLTHNIDIYILSIFFKLQTELVLI